MITITPLYPPTDPCNILPLMGTITRFAEAVTPITTWWEKPYTVAQLRAHPYNDPATSHRMGFL